MDDKKKEIRRITMSNPKVRNLIIVGAVFVVLIVSYILIANWKEKKDRREANLESEKANEESIDVYSTDSKGITKISFTNKDCSCNFTYNAEADLWTCDEHTDWTLDKTKIDAILTAVSNISAKKEITEPDKLSSYSLEEPELKVTIDTAENGSYSFMVGGATPSGDSYYYMVADATNVYVVDTTIMDAFSYNATQFIAVEEIDSLESNNIYSMDVAKNDGSKVISYYYDGDKTDDSVAANWYVTAPYDTKMLGDETYIYEYMSNYASLAYTECVDFAPTDLSLYGLDNPSYTINFKYFDKEEVDKESAEGETENEDSEKETVFTQKDVTYYIGGAVMGPADDTESTKLTLEDEEETEEETEKVLYYYVTSSATNSVFLMAADVVDALVSVDSFEFVNAAINTNDIMAYDNLTVTYGGKDYVVTKESTTETDKDGDEVVNYTYKFNGFKASAKKGQEACDAIAALAVTRKISETVEDNTPVAKFVYNGGDANVSITFLPYNDSFYRVNKDGAEYFLIEKQDLDSVLETIVSLSE